MGTVLILTSLVKMKRNFLFSFLGLVTLVFAAPQQDFLNNIQGLLGGGGQGILRNILNNPVVQSRILNNNLNPCDGVQPTTCQCTDGQIIPFSIEYQSNPCSGSARPDQCTCPNGNSFYIQDLADNVLTQYNLPSCGRRGLGGIPSSCTCPNGNSITANQFISRAL